MQRCWMNLRYFFVECQNASESIDSVFILGYADNIKKLMLKLHDRSRNVFWELRSPREKV